MNPDPAARFRHRRPPTWRPRLAAWIRAAIAEARSEETTRARMLRHRRRQLAGRPVLMHRELPAGPHRTRRTGNGPRSGDDPRSNT